MHPDLLNNSLFLSYYSRWQKNPDSVVFASIADYFLRYQMIDNAYKVCKEGLRRNPKLSIGHIVMAKIHMARGNLEEAEEELNLTLRMMPASQLALELMDKIGELKNKEIQKATAEKPEPSMPGEWQTVTMAQIFANQGHVDRAREIYYAILERDPQNEEAHHGLAAINS